jgi:hypothetical protein
MVWSDHAIIKIRASAESADGKSPAGTMQGCEEARDKKRGKLLKTLKNSVKSG